MKEKNKVGARVHVLLLENAASLPLANTFVS